MAESGIRLSGGQLAQVSISLNRRTYRFECGEDDVERLEKLANYLKSKLDALSREHGPIGDERLVIMAALALTDELFDARADVDELLEGTADEQTEKLRSVSSNAGGKAKPAPPSDAALKSGS